MHGLHPELGFKGVIFAAILELLFIGFCTVLLGHGLTELKKKKDVFQNTTLVGLSFALATGSLYMLKLFVEN